MISSIDVKLSAAPTPAVSASQPDVKSVLVSVLSNQTLWGAILASVLIISLGYVLIKMKWFKMEWKTAITQVVMKVGLPALALKGFMAKNSIVDLQQQAIVLGIAFGFYISLLIIAMLWVKYLPKLLPNSVKNATQDSLLGQASGLSQEQIDKKHRPLVLWMLIIFGSTTFFGIPIISQLYKDGGLLAANMWNIPYRIFLYSVCFMQIKGLKLDKANMKTSLKSTFVNPIIIATLLGLVLWLSQLIPGASSFGPKQNVGWFQFSVTAPWIFKTVDVLGALCSPLIWLVIGMTLAGTKLKEAFSDKWAWIYSLLKLIALPALIFGVFAILLATNSLPTDPKFPSMPKNIAIAMVIFAATPPATVAVAFCLGENKCANLAARCSAISTLCAVVMIPVWVVLCEVVFGLL
ncbi:AEC family transporter [Mycoplasmopsis alligatoris]|uniref:Transporter, auxin efflux carrier (AEC) family protein n=1 Tax=Mycoplasmopsis alligatoris A21JP2 TaxID=747682 RepID=D4XVE8_9BACT|nr:AEC family transporter [Mycoplasmopsis alligatoris]EFF41702.1 transporter, auxin efflux carrier (AEC) family protein [Mycoplasmopsis alligatoris A21JP2]